MQNIPSLALIIPYYSVYSYLLCALILIWISVYFRRSKQFKENVWSYTAKVVPLAIGLVSVAFMPLAIALSFIVKAFVGRQGLYVEYSFLASLCLCAGTLSIVFFLAIRRKRFAHSYKIFSLYFLLSTIFILSATIIGDFYDIKAYEARAAKFKKKVEANSDIQIMNMLFKIEESAAQGDLNAIKKLERFKEKYTHIQSVRDSQEMQEFRKAQKN